MTYLQRKILFWASTALFVVAIVPIMLYSFGYRFSIKEWKILRAGGLSVSSVPATGTRIFVDNKLAKETTLFSRSFFLQGLTPGRYSIRIEKDGYFQWEKTLAVTPERVTTAEALLVKQNPGDGNEIASGDFVSMRYYDESKKYIILTDKHKKDYFLSLSTNLIGSPPARQATTSPQLSAEAKQFLSEKKYDGFDYDGTIERILWWDKHNIWIRWLRGEEYLPLYTEKIEDLIFSSGNQITRAAFYPTREAIIVTFGNSLLVVELDGRDRRNEYLLYKGERPYFIISAEQKAVYVLDGGKLTAIPTL